MLNYNYRRNVNANIECGGGGGGGGWGGGLENAKKYCIVLLFMAKIVDTMKTLHLL
jgi:hypothetical protein